MQLLADKLQIIVEAILQASQLQSQADKLKPKIKAEVQISKESKGVSTYLKQLETNSKSLAKEMNRIANIPIDKNIKKNQMAEFFRINTNAAKKYQAQYESLVRSLNDVSTPEGLKKWNKEWQNLKSQIKATGDLGTGAFGSLTASAKKFFNWILASGGVMAIINGFRQMIQNVRELDTQMTELKKVTDEVDSTYSEFLLNAGENAVKLGSTISDLISATATFARLGYSLPEATDLGQVATVYKNVADGIENIDDASNILVSTMKAFNIQASESMSIADKLNEVGNKYAIGSAQLGDALQRSASALAAAGNDIDQSIGLITSAYEIIQNSEIVGKHMCPAA